MWLIYTARWSFLDISDQFFRRTVMKSERIDSVDSLLLGLSQALVDAGHVEEEADGVIGDALSELIDSGELEDIPDDEVEAEEWAELAKPMLIAKLEDMGYEIEDASTDDGSEDSETDDIGDDDIDDSVPVPVKGDDGEKPGPDDSGEEESDE
jgi:hypothetical protein